MRWIRCKELLYQHGEYRILDKFLWWPRCIENEYRWLEQASIHQRMFSVEKTGWWEDIAWIDEERS